MQTIPRDKTNFIVVDVNCYIGVKEEDYNENARQFCISREKQVWNY